MRSARRPTRRGTVVPTLGVCLIAVFAFVALAVDLGVLAVSRTQCQNAADVAALVGARNLNNQDGTTDTNRADALARARAAALASPHLSRYVQNAEVTTVTAGQYKYNAASQTFGVSYPGSVAAGDSWSAVKVDINAAQPTYFMRLLGVNSMPSGAAAVAVHRPRDLAFVLDLTGSMGYGSTLNWPYNRADTDPAEGLMNPDPAYPKFGHYARYTFYQTSNPSAAAAGPSTPIAARPNPLQMKAFVQDSSGGYAPANHTMMTGGGPPIIEDFLTAPGDPAAVGPSTPVKNAFKMWSPPQTSAANTATLTPATYDWSGYNALTAACPAPSNFDVQSDTPVAYAGDKWPRVRGQRGALSTPWTTVSGGAFDEGSAGAAKTLQEFLPVSASPYRDDHWENNGYGSFQGYSMGPGYWGKTFFIWPPDPRAPTASVPGDWRRRFFLRGDGLPFNPQPRISPAEPADEINLILFNGSPGHVLNPVVTTITAGYTKNNCPGYYRLNYPAIVAWLKASPRTLPTNLRAGRILYYSSMPDDLTTGAAGNTDDRTFWREYIHFILGVDSFDPATAPLNPWGSPPTVGYPPAAMMAGVESHNPFKSTTAPLSVKSADALKPTGATGPRPYMCYTDNINRPRMHFWFGPQSMLQFLKLTAEARPWWAGTVHESQCWQLKVAVNSVFDDLRRNHPNDTCGLAGFAARDTPVFNTPLANMGQDWYTLKNVLFFRKDTVADMRAKLVAGANPQTTSSTKETRPYASDFSNDTDAIPNGKGNTDPNSGLAVAFNMLSSSPTYGYGGRRGASKVVIFETDGLPNKTRNWSVIGSGVDTRYTFSSSGSPEKWTGDGNAIPFQAQYAVKVVERLVAPVSSTGTSGYSLPNAPARVYAVAFGDVFDQSNGPMSDDGQKALRFLLRVQQVGKTSPAAAGSIPAEQIITGAYDVRIANLKTALERIIQQGVAVTLVE